MIVSRNEACLEMSFSQAPRDSRASTIEYCPNCFYAAMHQIAGILIPQSCPETTRNRSVPKLRIRGFSPPVVPPKSLEKLPMVSRTVRAALCLRSWPLKSLMASTPARNAQGPTHPGGHPSRRSFAYFPSMCEFPHVPSQLDRRKNASAT